MSKEISLGERAVLLDEVGRRWLQKENPTTIAKTLKIPRKEVLEIIEEFRDVAKNSKELQDYAVDALHEYNESTNMLLREAWDILNSESDNKVRAGLIKTTADIDRQRVETLQKAGLYSDNSVGDQLVEMEEKAEAIKNLLKAVATTHPETRMMIMQGLQQIFGAPEPVDIKEGTLAIPE